MDVQIEAGVMESVASFIQPAVLIIPPSVVSVLVIDYVTPALSVVSVGNSSISAIQPPSFANLFLEKETLALAA